MVTKLFVGGLSWGTDDAMLQQAFGRFGELREAKVIMDRETGRSRGFAFVAFADEAASAAAVEAMNGATIDGRTIRVHEANDRPQRGPGGPGGPGGFDGPRGGGQFSDRGPPRGDRGGFGDRGPDRGGPHGGDRGDRGGHGGGPGGGQGGDRGAPPRSAGPGGFGGERGGFGGERGGFGGPRPAPGPMPGASRGGWDLAPPDDFGGGKRDRPRRGVHGPSHVDNRDRDDWGGGGRGGRGGRDRRGGNFDDFDE